MHQKGKLENEIFESLTVEEMRYVMNNIIDDEEIEWLHDYTAANTGNAPKNPYTYVTYRFGYDYSKEQYYNADNYEKWNEKYNLSKYNITYQKGYPKLWIVFEEGGVCGAISKTGSNISGAYGIPSSVVGQPGHAAYILYNQNANGDGVWSLWNDVSGWANSGKTEKLSVRMPNGWGNGSYAANNWTVPYIFLAQAALNEFNKYEKAEEILLLANTYSNDSEKLEEIYRKALETEEINFDAWYGLVNLYKEDNTKTEEDYYNLAKEIATTLKYYPLPMNDLLRMIKPYMESNEYNVKFTLLQTETLTEASKATDADSIQAPAVRTVANYLLGITDTSIATFSFDGENAGAIVLSSRFDDVDVRWDYSLDGGNTWNATNDHKVQLSNEEINSITDQNDIKVHIVGVDYTEENIYTIDIKTPTGLSTNLYANDLENRMIGATSAMEWKFNEKDAWTSYSIAEPNLTGDKTVIVRFGATGVYLPSNSETYKFTLDNQPDTNKYVPISHLSIESVSSEATSNGGSATNAIDGNINTIWHSNWSGSDNERYIVIKLDAPIYVSSIQYVPRQSGTNGRIKNAQLLVSTDGETWTEAGIAENWANDVSSKTIELNESVKTQYIKLIATQSYGDGRSFISAAMINIFEDTTKIESEEDLYIESENYKIEDTYLYKVSPNTTLEELKNNLKTNENATIKVYKQNKKEDGEIKEVELSKDDIIGTGMTLKCVKDEQEKILIIAVIGDLNGDGETDITDLVKVRRHIQEIEKKEGIFAKAGDINEDGEIDITDLVKVRRHIQQVEIIK